MRDDRPVPRPPGEWTRPLWALAVVLIDAGDLVRSLPAWARGRAPLDLHHCRESARWHAARGRRA